MHHINSSEVRLTSFWLPLIWTALFVSAFSVEVVVNNRLANRFAEVEATSSFEKDVIYRKWAALHGGVYAPVTVDTPPNPYLSHMPERDITTPGGTKLTLINPAYMTRQVHVLGKEQYENQGHITSLDPYNPINVADEWETLALNEFEAGAAGVSGIQVMDGQQFFKYMRPLITEESCLKCHAKQGYEVGDVRGGVTISVPMRPFMEETNAHTTKTGIVMSLIWLAGMVGLAFTSRNTKQAILERRENHLALETNISLLSDSETRYKMLTSMTSDYAASILVDKKGSLTSEWTVGSFEEITGHPIQLRFPARLETTHPEDRERQQNDISLTLTNQCTTTEFRSIRPDGTCVWLKVSRKPIWDEAQQRVVRYILVAQNITKRKITEIELLRQKNFLQKAQEIGSIGTWTFDIRRNELKWTDENYKILGVPIGTPLTYETFLGCIHPDDRKFVDTHWKAAFNKIPYDIEHRLLVDGKVKWVREKADLIFDENDDCIYATGVTQDITDRKLSEQSRLKSEERYRSVVEDQTELINRFLPDGTFLFVNDVFCRFFGRTREELLGNQWMPEAYADDISMVEKKLATLSPSNPVVVIENRVISGNKNVRWMEFINRGIFDEKEILIEIQSVGRDITDRKRAEDTLAENEEKYRLLFERDTDAIFIYDPVTTKILDANKATSLQYDYSIDELIGMSCLELSAEPDISSASIETIRNSGKVDVPVRYHKKKDGTAFPVSISGYSLTINGKDVMYAVSKDLTESKRSEQEKHHLEEQLRQTQKMEAIGTLAGGIAHDFNNLLFAILGNASLAADDLPEESPIQHNIDEINTAGHRAAELVSQILTFARKGEKNVAPINVMLIVKEVSKLLRATLPTTIGIDLRLDAKNTTIIGDPTEIHQVAMNLCTNAGHAMMETGGRLEIGMTEVTIAEPDLEQFRGIEAGQYLVLSISDTGPGIPLDIQERIFEPFFTTKEAGKGTGMGLAVVHGIVEDLGGTINVYSEIGQGTTFNVYLPLTKIEHLSEDLEMVETPMGNERVLVVDDEPMLAEMTKNTIEGLGYSVKTAKDGETALEMFMQSDGFELVITDQTMPKMTGAELAKKILARHPNQPIILITGFSQTIPREKSEEIGIAAYLNKPISKHALGVTIRRVLDKNLPDS